MIAGALEIQMFADIARITNDMNQVKNQVGGAMGHVERAVDSAKRVLGTLGVGLSVGVIINKFQQVAMETDKLRGNLVTMTGSTDAAGIAFDNLTKFAAKTPFTLDQSVNAFIKLKALGLDPSERALMSYGNTAAAMGKDMMQMIEAVADASTGEFERLKEFGIKARQQGDNVTLTFQGVSTTIKKESTAIQEYLLAIGETKFGDAMANQMERLPGLLSNLDDSVDALFRTMADSGGTAAFSSIIRASTSAVTGLTENLDVAKVAAEAFAVIMAGRYVMAMTAGATATSAFSASLVAMRTVLASLLGPTGLFFIAAGAALVLIQRQKESAEAAWAQAASFDGVRASLGALTQQELARAIQKEFEHVESLKRSRDQLDRASDGSAAFEEKIRKLNVEIEAAQSNHGLLVRQLERVKEGWKPVTKETEEATKALENNARAARALILMMDNTEQAYVDLMVKMGATADVADLVTTRTTRLTEAQREATLVNADAQDSVDEIVAGLGRQGAASQELTQITNLMRDDISGAFADMMMNGDNAFDAIAKSFERMVYKMVADWAASGIMNIVGKALGVSGLGGTSALGAVFGGGGAAGAAASAATGAASGGGMLAGIGGAAKAVGGKLMGAAAAIPGWGWALAGGAALAAVLGDKSTPSSNAGILLSDLPGVDASRKQDIPAFASGVDPVLFARREDFGTAANIAEALRAADQAVMDRFAAAGKTFQITGPQIAGFSETGRGGGQFLGAAAEDGNVALTAQQSIAKYMQELITVGGRYTGIQINPSGSPDQMLEQLSMALSHGSHAAGLDYVPFDGYRAILHRGERVQTAAEARMDDGAVSSLAGEVRGLQAQMAKVAQATQRTADLLRRVTRDGESLVTVPA